MPLVEELTVLKRLKIYLLKHSFSTFGAFGCKIVMIFLTFKLLDGVCALIQRKSRGVKFSEYYAFEL